MSESRQKEQRSHLDKRQDAETYVKNLKAENDSMNEAQIKESQEREEARRKQSLSDKKDKKVLAIVGTAGSRHLAPYNDPNIEIWGVAHCLLLQDIPRMDKVFEIHLPVVYNEEISPYSKKPIIMHANKEHACPWRKAEDMSVIVSKENPEFNKQEVFPRQQLKDKYEPILPIGDGLYETNSIAWMITYAIDMDKFDEIHLYGIHLETESEWGYERPCVEMWLGIFTGIQIARGAKTRVVYVPEMAPIMRGYHEYGFAEIETFRKELHGRIEFFDKALKDHHIQMNRLMGQKNALIKDLEISIPDKAKGMKDQVEKMTAEIKKYEDLDEEGKKKFVEEMSEKIKEQISNIENDIRFVENRISAFNGAKEQNTYFLKRLNA